MMTNENDNHCFLKFHLTTILSYSKIAYLPWLLNYFIDFHFFFLISIVPLEKSPLMSIFCPFNFFAAERTICYRKLGNYCSWRGVIGVTHAVSSFNIISLISSFSWIMLFNMSSVCPHIWFYFLKFIVGDLLWRFYT